MHYHLTCHPATLPPCRPASLPPCHPATWQVYLANFRETAVAVKVFFALEGGMQEHPDVLLALSNWTRCSNPIMRGLQRASGRQPGVRSGCWMPRLLLVLALARGLALGLGLGLRQIIWL